MGSADCHAITNKLELGKISAFYLPIQLPSRLLLQHEIKVLSVMTKTTHSLKNKADFNNCFLL